MQFIILWVFFQAVRYSFIQFKQFLFLFVLHQLLSYRKFGYEIMRKQRSDIFYKWHIRDMITCSPLFHRQHVYICSMFTEIFFVLGALKHSNLINIGVETTWRRINSSFKYLFTCSISGFNLIFLNILVNIMEIILKYMLTCSNLSLNLITPKYYGNTL